MFLTEEEREAHLHIIGTTREGKSKFIEHLIRGDIQAGHGVCLLDPSDRAETAYAVLRYCASIGFDKVCLIDPHTVRTHNRVTGIQPFNYRPSQRDATVARVRDTVRIMFDEKEVSTPRVNRYLSALLRGLLNSEMTLAETLYFSDYINPDYRARRLVIRDRLQDNDRDTITLDWAFSSSTRFESYFSSTINRFDPLWLTPIRLMLGGTKGVDFTTMITEGWVILVSLDADDEVEPIHTRLIGNLVINELIAAMTKVIRRNKRYGKTYRKPYYLYVDEAGDYVNDRLLRVLELKSKTNFRVTISHQSFSQFKPDAAKRVKQITKTKIMFDTPGVDDRLEMSKSLGYGGKIDPVMASYVNSNLPKQTIIIKKPKQEPVRIKVIDVKDPELSIEDENAFTLKVLSQPWTKSPYELQQEIDKRTLPTNSSRSQPRRSHDRKTVSSTPVSPGLQKRREQQGLSKGNEKSKNPPKAGSIKI